MILTIYNYHDLTVKVRVTSFTPTSTRPIRCTEVNPPEGGEVEFTILNVDTGLDLGDCDPEDNAVLLDLVRGEELTDRVFEAMTDYGRDI